MGVEAVDDTTVVFTTKLTPNVSPKVLGGNKQSLWQWQSESEFEFDNDDEEQHCPFLVGNYAKLPRLAPKNLPRIHSRDAEFLDSDIEETYKKIYRGEFTIETTREAFLDYEQKTSYQFTVKAQVRNSMVRIIIETDANHNLKHYTVGRSADFADSLSISQTTALQYRVLHLFLRHQGVLLHEFLFRKLSNGLMQKYRHSGWWKEALDVAMIRCDVAHSQDHHWRWKEHELFKVAQLLQAAKFHEQASFVYQDMIAFFCDESSEAANGNSKRIDVAGHASAAAKNSEEAETFEGNSKRVMLYDSAGCASAAAKNFEEAEELYMKALHLESIDNVNAGKFPWSNLLLRQFLIFYNRWGSIRSKSFDFPCNATFVALLLLAGAKNHEDPSFYEDRMQMFIDATWCPKTGALGAVKPAYHSKKAAQRVLTSAVSGPCSAAKFHSTIMHSSMLGDYYLADDPAFMHPSQIQRREREYSKEKKVEARQFQSSSLSKCCNSACFSGKGIPTHELKFCPCKMVHYVSLLFRTHTVLILREKYN